MIILGYSGLDASIRYAERDPDLRAGEERMVQGLDSAAAVIVDGDILAAAAEERFCGEKHTNKFPVESIRYCLDAAGIRANQIDVIAHGFNYGRYASIFRTIDAAHYDSVLDPNQQIVLWRDRLDIEVPAKKFVSVQHHLAHGASSYFPSGFKDALCVVCDGMGETDSLTIYAVRDGQFQQLARHAIKDSLGILYSLVTFHLGFKFNADEYKLMGLAPYGDAETYKEFFDGIVELAPKGNYRLHLDRLAPNKEPYHRGILRHLQAEIITRPSDPEEWSQCHRDFAAAVQKSVETVLFHVIEYWREHTGLSRLCMAGGVALNCTFNGKLGKQRLFDEIYVQPAAGDDGTAMGAALVATHARSEMLSPTIVRALPFYGPSYAKDEIREAIRTSGVGLDVADLGSDEAAAEDAAAALANEQIVAWFQGRMEYGPRALGNRSILANPLIPDIKDSLNRIIKLREGFRPFAPAATVEWAQTYFDFLPSSLFDYMLSTCPVRAEWRHRLPGITHVDGSARLQTVAAEQNSLFHQLITSFGKITGVYCIINTSFNLSGQPMIISPTIAIDTFRKASIDRLYIGPFLLRKRK